MTKPLQWIGADELLTSQSGFQDYVVGMKSLTWKMSKCNIDQEVSQMVSPQSMSMSMSKGLWSHFARTLPGDKL